MKNYIVVIEGMIPSAYGPFGDLDQVKAFVMESLNDGPSFRIIGLFAPSFEEGRG